MKANRDRTNAGRVSLVSIVLVSLFLGNACGSFRSDSSIVPANVTPVTLRYVTSDEEARWEDALLERFHEEHPHIQIQPDRIGRYYWPRDFMQHEQPPDLMPLTLGFWLWEPAQEQLAADLSEVWAQSELLQSYSMSLRNVTALNGKQYLLPMSYSWNAIYYNQALFAQLGLEPPQTWDQLLQTADILLAHNITPFSLSGDVWNLSLWFDYLSLRLNGPEFHQTLLRGEISYQDDRVRNVFVTWQTMFDTGYFGDMAPSLSATESFEAIVDGGRTTSRTQREAAMVLGNSDMVEQLSEDLQEQLAFFPFPTIEQSVSSGEVISVWGYTAPARASHLAETMSFLSYLLKPETEQFMQEFTTPESTLFPIHLSGETDGLAPRTIQGLELVTDAEHLFLSILATSPKKMSDFLRSQLAEYVRKAPYGTADVDTILKTLEVGRKQTARQEAFFNTQ
ncbi:extracellular solute-binding protein [Chloroflexi bacterium TSY]|nr:extracellular solute-binding protein [Chloroflexi bacterium TSY]